MSVFISLLNDVSVGVFGAVLSASFCNALRSRRNRWIFWIFTVVILLVQGVIYTVWDASLLRNIYPLIVHLPLALLLWYLSKQPLWSAISVLFAYLCCQLRRWLALLVMTLAAGGGLLQDAVELVLTVPLLLLLLHFFAPAVASVTEEPKKQQLHFGIVPTLYYAFDYLAVVYTDHLVQGLPVVVEFMPFVCCATYLVFLLHHSRVEQKRLQLLQKQESMRMQLKQSVTEITALRQSQALARQYRHDLRHHLQYVSSCIENGQTEQAQTYITGIFREIEAQKVERYCENEAANLILSAFAARAAKDHIALKVQGALPPFLLLSDSDLCVILSNGLENALHACQKLPVSSSPTIDVQFFQRENKLFLQITNPCEETVHFENGLPVSTRHGHGIGVESICAIVERYGGICSFSVKDKQFILRLSV